MNLAIFDVDGTLTDSHGYDVHFFAVLAEALDAPAVDDVPVVGCDGRPSRAEVMRHALAVSEARHGPFERVVYVGDAAWDVRACRELGWNFLGLNADRGRLRALGATHVLADYRDLDAAQRALQAAGVPG